MSIVQRVLRASLVCQDVNEICAVLKKGDKVRLKKAIQTLR